MIVEVTDTLGWHLLFLAIDTQLNGDFMQLQVLSLIQPLLIKCNTFLIERQVKSEMAAFKVNIKKLFGLFMNITTSDGKGWWWSLHSPRQIGRVGGGHCMSPASVSMQIFHGNFSGFRRNQFIGLVLGGKLRC